MKVIWKSKATRYCLEQFLPVTRQVFMDTRIALVKKKECKGEKSKRQIREHMI